MIQNFTNTTMSRRLMMGLLILLLNALTGQNRAYATHAAGTDLTYTYNGNNQYWLEVSFYRDCAGIDEPDSAAILCTSGCTQSFTVYALKVPGTGVEITTPCVSANTTCNGGSLTGIRRFVYRKLVTLSPCANWVFSFHECCRNCSITTINNPCGNNSELYVEAKLDNLLAPGNSSPSFSNLPVAFVCVGQNFTYNHGVLDPDNDSLSYSLIAPKISAGSTVSFTGGATATSPLASSTPFTINNITGDINFTPSAIQIGVMAVLVKEYRNGQLIGSVIRDMQVYTQNCTNAIPSASGIDSTNSYSVTVCPDQTLCFDIYSADADTSQSVTMTTNNGIPGATYTISPGSRPVLHFCWTPGYADANLLPNTFTVTVRDNNCPSNAIQTFSYNVFVPSPYFTVASTPASCFGGSNGTANATPVYGNTYSYSWNTNPVTTTAAASGLSAGVYTVTVSDNNQCSASATVEVVQPVLLEASVAGYNALCNGEASGLADLTVNGGLAGYTFVWSNGATTEDISGITAGTYTVTVYDMNQCEASASVVIGEPDALFLNILSSDASCLGNNGSADLTPGGGSFPYSFIWSNGETTEDISGLGAGAYTVTVTDNHGCVKSAVISINSSSALSGIIFAADVLCNGDSNGSADLSPSGGTPPYTYLWSNGETTEDLSGLAAGIYTVTVYDELQCTYSTSVEITGPDALGTIIFGSSALCNAGTGSADLNVTGGTAPYSYLWSNGETTEDLNSLTAGTYTVTVTDVNGCSTEQSVEIEGSSANLVLTPSALPGLCYGSNDGSILLAVSGGASPYSFLWSDGSTNQDLTGVAAGAYTVTVTDANGCDATALVNLTAPPALVATVAGYNGSCKGKDGSLADLTVTGGTAPYTYSWSNGETSEDLAGLASGTYTVTVTDANGCNTTADVTLVNGGLYITFIVNNVSCNGGSDGSIQSVVTGGTPPYVFLWTDGETTQDLSNLAAGVYDVTVEDQNKCQASAKVLITEPAPLDIKILAIDVTCKQDGEVKIWVSGGTAPYSYLWSNGETTQDITGLQAGTYTVTVTDVNGCTIVASATVHGLTNLNITLVKADPSYADGPTGSIDLTVDNGIPPFSFAWNNGASSEDLHNIPAGLYEVTVTDAQQCQATAMVILYDPQMTGIHEADQDFSVSHYPVPASEELTIAFSSTKPGYVNVVLFSADGKQIDVLFDGMVKSNKQEHIRYNVMALSPGMYFYKVTTAYQQQTHKLLITKER